MSFGKSGNQQPYPDDMREAVFRKALSGTNLKEIRHYWVNILDPNAAYSEPIDKTLGRWMSGEHLPKGARERVLLDVLGDRYGIPPEIIKRMVIAWANRAPTSRAKRYAMWKKLRKKLRKAQREEHWPWHDGMTLVLYSTLIVGAKTVEDFPGQILGLYQRYDGKYGVMFYHELEQMVGLDKESRDAELAQA